MDGTRVQIPEGSMTSSGCFKDRIYSSDKGDLFYIEHPRSFRFFFKKENQSWTKEKWMLWVRECIQLLTYFPHIQKKIQLFYQKEILTSIEISSIQMKYINEKVEGFDIILKQIFNFLCWSFSQQREMHAVSDPMNS